MGQWHDNRFKRLHQQRAVILEWAHFVSQRLGLGPVDPDSLDVHPTAYAAARGGQRLADGAWIFRTALEARLLCLWEFQSTQDAVLRLRQAHYYALGQLLAGHEAGRFRVREGLPAPILISLYTGRRPHIPKPVPQLIVPQARHLVTIDIPAFHFDMLHMTSSDIPDRDLLATIFHIERETDPPRLTGLLQRFIERTNNVDLHAIIVQFATAALARWANVRDEQGQPLVSEQALAAVSNVRDYQMYAQLLQERLDQMVAEGKAEGKAEGEAHGKAQERRQSLIATASIYLDPETLDSCQVWLSHCPLDQMPTVHDLVQTAKSASDPAQAIVDLFRRTGDAATETS